MDDRTRRIWEDILQRERMLLEREMSLPLNINSTPFSKRLLYGIDRNLSNSIIKKTAKRVMERQDRLISKSLCQACQEARDSRWERVLTRKIRQVFTKIPSGGLKVTVANLPLTIGIATYAYWVGRCRFPRKNRVLEVSGNPLQVSVSEGWITDGLSRFKQAKGNCHDVIREVIERSHSSN